MLYIIFNKNDIINNIIDLWEEYIIRETIGKGIDAVTAPRKLKSNPIIDDKQSPTIPIFKNKSNNKAVISENNLLSVPINGNMNTLQLTGALSNDTQSTIKTNQNTLFIAKLNETKDNLITPSSNNAPLSQMLRKTKDVNDDTSISTLGSYFPNDKDSFPITNSPPKNNLRPKSSINSTSVTSLSIDKMKPLKNNSIQSSLSKSLTKPIKNRSYIGNNSNIIKKSIIPIKGHEVHTVLETDETDDKIDPIEKARRETLTKLGIHNNNNNNELLAPIIDSHQKNKLISMDNLNLNNLNNSNLTNISLAPIIDTHRTPFKLKNNSISINNDNNSDINNNNNINSVITNAPTVLNPLNTTSAEKKLRLPSYAQPTNSSVKKF